MDEYYKNGSEENQENNSGGNDFPVEYGEYNPPYNPSGVPYPASSSSGTGSTGGAGGAGGTGGTGGSSPSIALAVISLVFGILSVITCCCSVISILLGLVALTTGIISRHFKMGGSGMAIAGIILGAVGVGGYIVWVISSHLLKYSFIIGISDFINELLGSL